MIKNYLLSILFFILGFAFNNAFAQIIAQDDFVSIPNGSGTSVILQDVTDNDTYGGMPVNLSDGYFLEVSSSSNYFSIDANNGSVIFSNGPVPNIGTYTLDYGIQNTSFVNGGAMVYINVGCDEVNPPYIISLTSPTCISNTGSITLGGLPATGTWVLVDNGTAVMQGTGTTATINNISATNHNYAVYNSQQCRSTGTLNVNLNYLNFNIINTYVDSNSDGIVSVGDTIQYTGVVTNQGGCNITNIAYINGNIVLSGNIPSLAPGATDSTSLTGSYVLTQANINAGKVSRNVAIRGMNGSQNVNASATAVNILNQTNGIKLAAFVDTNGNGLQDIGESNFNLGEFQYVINDDGVVHHLSAHNASYLYETNPANSYDLSFHVYPEYAPWNSLVVSSYPNITVAIGSGITTYNFPVTVVPYVDLSVVMYNVGVPRPGFTYTNYIYVRNRGNQVIPSATLTFNKDNTVSMVSSTSGTVPTANGFTYTFTDMAPGQMTLLIATMQVPTIPTVALGDVLTNTASITIPAGDIDEANNSSSLTQTIVGSYDPNDKTESHAGKVIFADFTADDYLTYTIRFENTGTASAEFVRVNDVLDNKLDETSVRMVDASHRYQLDRVGSNLSWFFEDIQLPPSVANTNIGHGYLVFQVKPKPGFALGDVIPNTADIFFDFNPAIVTEPCVTEFVTTLATDTFALSHFKTYPNPVKNTFHINNETAIDTFILTSITGQTIITKNINAFETEIDMTTLSKGIYFAKVTSQNQDKTIKIIKD